MSQTQGKDLVIETFIGTNGQHLNYTTTGWQFGSNRDRHLITDLTQVIGPDPEKPVYPKAVVDRVALWLGSNGVAEAKQQLVDREVSEQASDMPGSLDAMAEKLGPAVKSQLFQMMKAALHGNVDVTPPSPQVQSEASTGMVDGVPVVEDAKGIKHRLPDPVLANRPKVIQVDGGVLLDKGNGHKEFRADFDGTEDEEEEAAILAAHETARPSKKKR